MQTNSPKSGPENSPAMEILSPKTPKDTEITEVSDEVIPETPPKCVDRVSHNGIIETPKRSEISPEYKLITPLGSGCKIFPLSRMYRQKSFCMHKEIESASLGRKENLLRKRTYEDLRHIGAKLQKTEEHYTISTARAALFQEAKNDSKLKNLTLSTKTFYSNCGKTDSPTNFNKVQSIGEVERRKSLPSSFAYSRRSIKRHKRIGINGAVSHGIKKPKVKQHSQNSRISTSNNMQNLINPKSDSPKENISTETLLKERVAKGYILKENMLKENIPATEILSPEVDPNKRFFKTNRTIRQNHVATVTVSNNIKLNVADGKIALKEYKHSLARHPCRRRKLDILFDTADLTVDEPEVEALIKQSKVDNILKVLEEDWANDDYDTMEVLVTGTQSRSDTALPSKANTVLNDVTMSPASELSNMTSTMNIEDATIQTTFENITTNDSINNNNKTPTTQKYYPLFTKGYSSGEASSECSTPKSSHGKGQANLRLFKKRGGGEDQYQLDVGQKRFGATQCKECNVIYQIGDPEDENAHLNYHNSIKTLKFPGWKNERTILTDMYTDSRIILIEPDDPKQCWNKVSSILQVVDRDLGLAETDVNEYLNKRVYLYIRGKCVLGVLVAEHIESAHRMIPDLLELDCCTAESTPAKCGINVVWTAMSHRKQGIATKLVDTLRAQFFYGYVMALDDIAFSIPTPGGKVFAAKYTKTRNFKVYN